MDGLRPTMSVHADMRPAGEADPLFDPLDGGRCRLDPALVRRDLADAGAVVEPATRAALDRLQQLVAPRACAGGPGVCLSGEDRASVSDVAVKLSGPVAVGATLAENLLLEYEAGLPLSQVGRGRVTRSDLDRILVIHERASALTRRLPSIARARGARLAGLISQLLSEPDQPVPMSFPAGRDVPSRDRLVLLVGHDTNLDNLAGVFGLDWRLPGQPDATAPGSALAFELWSDAHNGSAVVRIKIFYQTPDDVRSLSDGPVKQAPVSSTQCGATGHGPCSPSGLVALSSLGPDGCRSW